MLNSSLQSFKHYTFFANWRDTLKAVKTFLTAACLLVALSSCNHSTSPTAEKHYPFTGKVISVSPSDQTASIDGAAIPNYMDAMRMDYPIKSKDDLQKLHPGDLISATVNVGDSGSYNLTEVKVTGHVDLGKK